MCYGCLGARGCRILKWEICWGWYRPVAPFPGFIRWPANRVMAFSRFVYASCPVACARNFVAGKAPVILIGAGTGIGPLAGFIRNNTGKHPMFLYWGGRDPASDFLYKPELDTYLADGRLTGLHAAFSRVQGGTYVQDRVLEDSKQLRQLLEQGGQVLVCGGRAMAKNIAHALDEVLAPLSLSVATLKAQGRYREDVF